MHSYILSIFLSNKDMNANTPPFIASTRLFVIDRHKNMAAMRCMLTLEKKKVLADDT